MHNNCNGELGGFLGRQDKCKTSTISIYSSPNQDMLNTCVKILQRSESLQMQSDYFGDGDIDFEGEAGRRRSGRIIILIQWKCDLLAVSKKYMMYCVWRMHVIAHDRRQAQSCHDKLRALYV